MFMVEKGVPLPDTKNGRKSYPFGEMEVGDSFHAGFEHRDRIRSAASCFGTRNGMKFSIRKDGQGFRVWRVA